MLWEDAGDPPDVPPLFVMSFVEGTSLEPLFDLDGDEDEAVVAERMRNAARTLAALHALDPDAIGLAAEPVVGPDEEIDRWCRLLETVDPALVPGWEDVAAALRPREPPPMPVRSCTATSGSATCSPPAPRSPPSSTGRSGPSATRASTSAGSSLNADPATYRRATPYAASLPSPAELAELYADALGRDVPDLEWFQALACFKSTATWSLIVKHNRRRAEPDPDLEAMAAVLPDLLARAGELMT